MNVVGQAESREWWSGGQRSLSEIGIAVMELALFTDK